jgi:hypothetical protein
MHARGIVGEDAREHVRAVEVRRRTRVGHGTRREQTLGRGRARRVQRVKTAGPPAAPTVRVRAEVEEYIDQRNVVALGQKNERRRIERTHGRVHHLAQLGVGGEERANGAGITLVEGSGDLGQGGGHGQDCGTTGNAVKPAVDALVFPRPPLAVAGRPKLLRL